MTKNYFEHYRQVNDLSPEGRRQHWAYLDATIGRHLRKLPATTPVLDVGCGAGIALEWLKERGFTRAWGVDIDAGQVEFARRLGVDASLANDPVEWLRTQPRAQWVILKDVLEHLDESARVRLLAALRDALLPGGRVFLTVPNASASFATRWLYNDPTHKLSFTEHSLRWELGRGGLTLERVERDDPWVKGSVLWMIQQGVRRVFRAWRRLEAIAELGREGFHIPLSLNLIATAKRDAD